MDNVKHFHFIVVALAGWVNRHQQAIIDERSGSNGGVYETLNKLNPVFYFGMSKDKRARISPS